MPAYARIASLAGLTLAALAVLPGAQPSSRATSPAPVIPAQPGPAEIPADTFLSARTYTPIAAPVRLRIPALHVDTALQHLGLQPDGTVAVPASTGVAGWYDRGPRPGQPGPAVILGHVDSHTGPGVFIGLARVRVGTAVRVDRADGSAVTFRITQVAKVPKVRFPTDLVYAPTLDPTLRLVTCGGSFDHTRGSYRDNVIAYADEV
jgi:sortase (surface protein transpeptidase)